MESVLHFIAVSPSGCLAAWRCWWRLDVEDVDVELKTTAVEEVRNLFAGNFFFKFPHYKKIFLKKTLFFWNKKQTNKNTIFFLYKNIKKKKVLPSTTLNTLNKKISEKLKLEVKN